MDRPNWGEREWDRLVEQLSEGDCTPFLGAGACTETMPLGAEMAREWATKHRYPFANESSLPDVMQYVSILEGDPVTVKRRVARKLTKLAEPDFSKQSQPHALLAGLPIKVHLTTNYDDFMSRALVRAGKRPVKAVCPWYRGAEADPDTTLPEGYKPQVDEPLVYHLHGTFRRAASLVLAEEDYLEFLINLAKDLGEDAQRMVPPQVLPALTRQPLLFIGYSLRDWSFRMVYRGIIEAVASVQQRRHVGVQLAPDPDMTPDKRRRAEAYLTKYYDALNISVYWGSADDFCAELGSRLEKA